MTPTCLHLFAGSGGGALGFQRAGFRSVGAFDFDASACRDLEYLTGERATVADLGSMTPDDLRAACTGRPDVVFTSPPCKSFSGCLPSALATTDRYLDMSNLALRGIWLVLEAWPDSPPPLIVMENVPRIQSRGRRWLDQVAGMLHAYGYAVRETTHDCGELGGLAQHRRRFLLVARHMAQVPEFLYEPPKRRVRGVGEVLGELPVPLPGSTEGGPMHRLPRMSAMNWVRLALIPAGGDWRDLPAEVHLTCEPRAGGYGVAGWGAASATVVGSACHDNSAVSIADPRVDCERREGGHGVRGWDQPSVPIIGHATVHNHPSQVADPRITHASRGGNLNVTGWAEPSHTIIGDARAYKGANVADPRVPTLTGPPIDLDSTRPTYIVIRAADGTWHRPMTTLELAAIQGLPAWHRGDWLRLDGSSHRNWRQHIGNMVPPPAAEAIARSMLRTLEAAWSRGLLLSGEPVWVGPRMGEVSL